MNRLAVVLLMLPCWTPGASARVIPPSVLPGVGPGAARVPVDVDSVPWRAVVRVQTEIGGQCSGVLIGPRTVLTAAHCLFGRGTGRLLRPGSIHVLTGYFRGDYAGHARAASFVIGPGFAAGPDSRPLASAPPDADWAVLHLEAPLGTPDRVLPLLRDAPPAGTRLALGGYEQDRAQAMLADLSCVSEGLVRDAAGHTLLRHTCAATRGTSGAPLLARSADGTWGVVGLAVRGEAGISGGYAVPAAAIAAAAASAPG